METKTSKKPARFKSLPKKVQPILGQIDFGIFAFRLTVDGVGFFFFFLVGEDKAPFPLDSTEKEKLFPTDREKEKDRLLPASIWQKSRH